MAGFGGAGAADVGAVDAFGNPVASPGGTRGGAGVGGGPVRLPPLGAEEARRLKMPYVTDRWLGGMLTNFDTISKRVQKMQDYERMRDTGEFELMPKKEALLISRELEKTLGEAEGVKLGWKPNLKAEVGEAEAATLLKPGLTVEQFVVACPIHVARIGAVRVPVARHTAGRWVVTWREIEHGPRRRETFAIKGDAIRRAEESAAAIAASGQPAAVQR